MNQHEKAIAATRLLSMRDVLSRLSAAFDDIAALAKAEGASALAFSALMLQESIEKFESELSAHVIKRIAEP